MITEFLVHHFSYTVLFIWSILEGEIGLALAGYMSKGGAFKFTKVISIAITGAMIGDTALFITGRVFKERVQVLTQRHERRLEQVTGWFKDNVVWLILFERFIYGTHIPSLLLIGMSGYSFMRFLLLDLLGVSAWAFTFTSLGYYFGESVINIVMLLQHHLSILLLCCVVAIVLFIQKRTGK